MDKSQGKGVIIVSLKLKREDGGSMENIKIKGKFQLLKQILVNVKTLTKSKEADSLTNLDIGFVLIDYLMFLVNTSLIITPF